MPIAKPSIEDLQPLLEEATIEAGQTEEVWIERLLGSLDSILAANPLRYRSYGPFWWHLKKALMDRGQRSGTGIFSRATFIDLDWLQAIDYGELKWNLLAAWAYGEGRLQSGLIYDPEHVLTDDGGEPVEYISADEEMEMLPAQR